MLFPSFLQSQDIDTNLTAEKIIVKPSGILEASGNVKVRRGNIYVHADKMIVDQNNRQIELFNIKEFFDGNSIILEAQNAKLSDDLAEGIISTAQVLINQELRLRAHQIELKMALYKMLVELIVLPHARAGKNEEPLWYFNASSANRDMKNKNIVYRDVEMRVKGVLAGFTPYLRLPDPEVDVELRGWAPRFKYQFKFGNRFEATLFYSFW